MAQITRRRIGPAAVQCSGCHATVDLSSPPAEGEPAGWITLTAGTPDGPRPGELLARCCSAECVAVILPQVKARCADLPYAVPDRPSRAGTVRALMTEVPGRRWPVAHGCIGAPITYAMIVCMAWKPASGGRRCVHKSSRTGEQCRLWGVAGTDPPTCKVHGASAPQVRAAAERRVEEGRVRELARKMDVDPAEFGGDPYQALRGLLARDQAEMERFGRLVAGLGDGSVKYAGKSGVEQLRAEFGRTGPSATPWVGVSTCC